MFIRCLPRIPRRVTAILAMSAGLLLAPAAQARLEPPDNGNGELFLLVWDPVAKGAYALDLGLTLDGLLAVGEADAGYQRFWTLDPATDTRLASFLAPGTASTSLLWGVWGGDWMDTDGIAPSIAYPGSMRYYTTLQHTTTTGTQNPEFTKLLARSNGDLQGALAAMHFYTVELGAEVANDHNTFSAGVVDDHGSAYHVDGQDQYFGLPAFVEHANYGVTGGPQLLNAVGSSSWAYRVSNSSDDSFAAATVDEFDNLTHDAFWGLAYSNGKLYLSYTLEGTGLSLAQASFMQSIGRTELNGGFSVRALGGVTAAGSETAAYFSRRVLGEATPMAAVPEPATWGLMGLGLLFTAAAAARRRQPGA